MFRNLYSEIYYIIHLWIAENLRSISFFVKNLINNYFK